MVMLTRGGLADEVIFVVTTNCKKSAEVIVPRKKLGKDRTIISLEYTTKGGWYDENGVHRKRWLSAKG